MVQQPSLDQHHLASSSPGSTVTPWAMRRPLIERSFDQNRCRYGNVRRIIDTATRRTQEYRDLWLLRPVNLITCTFDTLNYLTTTPDRLMKVLHCIRASLRNGGHFDFDLITGAGVRRRLSRQYVRLDARATWTVAIDGRRRSSSVDTQWRSRIKDGRLRLGHEVRVQRWYPLPSLCAVLGQCGLTSRRHFGRGRASP